MTVTYDSIATTTLGSAAATITFSSIPATYTDLRLVLVGTAAQNNCIPRLRFNQNAATNYSVTTLGGDGSFAGSARATDQTYLQSGTGASTIIGMQTSPPMFYSFDVFSYAGSTNKTVLTTFSEDQNGSGYVGNSVGLWRNTAAITRIDITNSQSANFSTGTTATLYGIKSE